MTVVNMPVPETVSIVIPAFNAEATIVQAVRACQSQDCSLVVDIIVVDDGSTDRTGERVMACPGIRYVRQNNAGPAHARNRGAVFASGDVICFTDADCLPHPGWVRALVCHFSDPSVGAVMGSYGIANPQSWLARAVYQEIIYRHQRMPFYPKVFGSYNVAIRKAVFHDVGGFNGEYRHASGEDNDLSYRILGHGYKIFFAKEALVDHYHPVSVKKYLREQYRHGFWRFRMYRTHPGMMRGDGYTFWKDSLEVALFYFLFTVVLVGVGPWPFVIPYAGLILTSIIILEINFNIKIKLSKILILKYSCVMALRALARAMGFLAGGISWVFAKRPCPSSPQKSLF